MARTRQHRPETEDTGGNPDLKRLLDTLQRSSIGEIFVTIRKRKPLPGEPWSWWKRKIPLDSVDDLTEFCYGAPGGGPKNEYRLEFHDVNGKPVKGHDGKTVDNRIVPALEYPDGEETRTVGTVPAIAVDPAIQTRRRELQTRKEELELDRQEAELARQRRRIERMKAGEDLDEDDDEDLGRYPTPYYNPYMQMPPWMQPKQDGTAEMLKALVPVLVAFITKPAEKSPLQDPAFLGLIMNGKGQAFEPKDIMSIMTPLMSQMGQLSMEQNRAAMQAMHEVDASIRERMLEMIMSDPNRSEDEIEKWKKYLGFGTEALGKLAHIAFGRPTLFPKEKGTVDVPVIGPRKNVPGLPGPKATQEKPGSPAAKPDKTPTPAEQAKEVIRQRVEVFLLGAEQEALIGSDPGLVAETLEETYLYLPQTLRFKLGKLDVGDTFTALRDYCPEIVDRILEAVAKDESGEQRKWFEAFWDLLKNPPEEEEEEEEEEEGEEEEEDGQAAAEPVGPPEEPDGTQAKRQPRTSAGAEGPQG